jgi:pimeloyl-ACP methyl ester carboxylesterase
LKLTSTEKSWEEEKTVGGHMIQIDGVELCTESFGDCADPPVLLIMGLGASMLWWPDDFCRALADGRRFVIRYDHRDTGRSSTYPPGEPGYSADDLLDDVVAILDAYELDAAHLVGVSAGGAMAQLLALDHPHRVLSLVLVSTSPAVAAGRTLPPPRAEFGRFFSEHQLDATDRASVIDYRVGYTLMLSGSEQPLDEEGVRRFISRDVARARDFAAAGNHDQLTDDGRERGPLSSITVPTLVVHGTADPMFPLEHGQALADLIPQARLLTVTGAGHGIGPIDPQLAANAILEHTSSV